MVSHEAGSSGIAMHDIDAQLFDEGGGACFCPYSCPSSTWSVNPLIGSTLPLMSEIVWGKTE